MVLEIWQELRHSRQTMLTLLQYHDGSEHWNLTNNFKSFGNVSEAEAEQIKKNFGMVRIF